MKTQDWARRRAGAFLLTTAVTGAGLFAATSPASASTPTACDAAALHLSALGAVAVTGDAANPASTPCATDTGVVDLSALGLLSASTVQASTAVTTGTGVVSHARVAGLHAGVSGVASTLATPLLSGPNSLVPAATAAINTQIGVGGTIATAIAPLKTLGLNVVGVDATNLSAALTASLPTALSTACRRCSTPP